MHEKNKFKHILVCWLYFIRVLLTDFSKSLILTTNKYHFWILFVCYVSKCDPLYLKTYLGVVLHKLYQDLSLKNLFSCYSEDTQKSAKQNQCDFYVFFTRKHSKQPKQKTPIRIFEQLFLTDIKRDFAENKEIKVLHNVLNTVVISFLVKSGFFSIYLHELRFPVFEV